MDNKIIEQTFDLLLRDFEIASRVNLKNLIGIIEYMNRKEIQDLSQEQSDIVKSIREILDRIDGTFKNIE